MLKERQGKMYCVFRLCTELWGCWRTLASVGEVTSCPPGHDGLTVRRALEDNLSPATVVAARAEEH